METCPNCGAYEERLDRITGWCSNCAPPQLLSAYEQYLLRYADEIDQLIADGFSPYKAFKAIKARNGSARTRCYSCHTPIKPATRGERLFCNSKPCRKTARRFRY